MASECCLSLTKYFLFLFNLIFFLLGSVLLSMGLWILLIDEGLFFSFTYISKFLFSYVLIVSGSVTMSLGFFGCLGSLMTVKCLLATYFILLMVLLTAQIVGGVFFYTQKSELTSKLQDHTIDLMRSFEKNDSSYKTFETTINYIQQKYKCCGWNGKDDYEEANKPCSCCAEDKTTVNATHETNGQNDFQCFKDGTYLNNNCSMYDTGCSKHITNWVDENLLIIYSVILALSVVEICGMILSMCLYKEGSMDYNTVLN